MSAILRGIGRGLARVGEALAGVGTPRQIPVASAAAAARELMDAWARAKAALLAPVKAVEDMLVIVRNQGAPLFVDKSAENVGFIRVTAVEAKAEGAERVVTAAGGRPATAYRLVFHIRVIRPTGENRPPRVEDYTVVVPGDARVYHLLPLAAIYALNRDRLAKLRFEHPRVATLLDLYVAPLADVLLSHYDQAALRELAEKARQGPISQEDAVGLLSHLRTAAGTWHLRVHEGPGGKPKAMLIESRGFAGRRSGWLWIEPGTPYEEVAPLLWEEGAGIEVKPFAPEFLTIAAEYTRHFTHIASALGQTAGGVERFTAVQQPVEQKPVTQQQAATQPQQQAVQPAETRQAEKKEEPLIRVIGREAGGGRRKSEDKGKK